MLAEHIGRFGPVGWITGKSDDNDGIRVVWWNSCSRVIISALAWETLRFFRSNANWLCDGHLSCTPNTWFVMNRTLIHHCHVALSAEMLFSRGIAATLSWHPLRELLLFFSFVVSKKLIWCNFDCLFCVFAGLASLLALVWKHPVQFLLSLGGSTHNCRYLSASLVLGHGCYLGIRQFDPNTNCCASVAHVYVLQRQWRLLHHGHLVEVLYSAFAFQCRHHNNYCYQRSVLQYLHNCLALPA